MRCLRSVLLACRLIPIGVGLVLGGSVYARTMTEAEKKSSIARAKKEIERDHCVEAMLELAGVAKIGGPEADTANFYIAQCQDKLGDYSLSYETASRINPRSLPTNQGATLKALIERLSAVPEPKPWSISAVAGTLTFSGDQSLKDGYFYDLMASYNTVSTSVTVDYEPASIKLVDGSDYSQTQMLIVAEQRFIDAIGVKLGYRTQSSSASTLAGASNIIAGARWFHDMTQVGVTYAMSKYPKYYPANLDVNQLTGNFSTAFGNAFDWGLLGLDLKYHNITPQMTFSKAKYPTVTAFKSAYTSTEIGLRYTLSPISLALSTWSGEQVFAVLGDGLVVWSNSTVHKGGQKLSLDYFYETSATIGLFYAKDSLENTSTNSTASVTALGLNGTFFF